MLGKIEWKLFPQQTPLRIECYRPSLKTDWNKIEDGRGGWRGLVRSGALGVSVFSFCGGRVANSRHEQREFTRLETVFRGDVYTVTLPRSYPRTWLTRLAHAFARQAMEAGFAKVKSNG